MKITYKQFFYFLICAVLMYLPRRWFILGIQSYRLILLLLLVYTIKKLRFNKSFFNLFTLLYIFYITLYYLIDAGIMSAFGFLLDTAGFFILIYSNVNSRYDIRLLLKVFSNCVCVYSVLCIIQTFTGINIFDIVSGTSFESLPNYYRFGLVRSYGSFNTSINNALFLVMASCVLLFMYENTSEKRTRKTYLIKYVLCIAAICACMSRAPILVLVLVWVLYLAKKGLFRFIYQNFLKIILLFVLALVLLVSSATVRNASTNFVNMFMAIFNDDASDSISSSFGVNVDGVGQRMILYNWVGQKVKGHEIIGLGPSSDPEFKYVDEWNKLRVKTSLENHYLKMLYNFGAIGMILFICFTLKMFRCTYKKQNKDEKRSISFQYMAILAEIAYAVCIFTVASVDDMRMYYFIICIAVLLNTKLDLSNEELMLTDGEK